MITVRWSAGSAAWCSAGLWVAGFVLACRVVGGPLGEGHAGVSVVERLTGGGRMLLSESLYLKADDYFHKGVPHVARPAFIDVFQRLREQVAPTAHKHTPLDKMDETMPWLRLAVMADERNVEAAGVAAYWLLKSGRHEPAERLLLQTIARNPDDYRPAIELARVYLSLREYDRAAAALDTGLKKWPYPRSATDRDVIYDLSWLLDFRAALFEREGRADLALPLVERQAALLPERLELAAHAARIRSGKINVSEVNARLVDLFGREPAQHGKEGGEGAGHGHDHEPGEEH
jgi:tetratricopeptide (TPR) repeat protein